jgi:hypothetical protein
MGQSGREYGHPQRSDPCSNQPFVVPAERTENCVRVQKFNIYDSRGI